MHLHLNPIGGLAGDMFCAALLDLRPELLEPLRVQLQALNPPSDLQMRLEQAPGSLHGRRFQVDLPQRLNTDHDHSHYAQIRDLLAQADLDPGVRQRAQAIFALLAEAEARVHGVELERVVFHEVGNWDAIVDILAAAFLLERLDITSCSCEPLPRGGGRVMTQHGWLPLPAPATAYLLEGLPLHDDGIGGERVTPTGAAILRSLAPCPMPAAILQASGYGYGSRQLNGLPNCVQAQLLATTQRPDYTADSVVELAFELDDQSPEDLAIGLETIRVQPGVLSLLRLDGSGKLGRPTWQVQLLVEPAAVATIADACFRETRTLGLRHRPVQRWTLERRDTRVEVDGRAIGVKLARGPDGWQAKAESRDLAVIGGQQRRRTVAQEAEAEALRLMEENVRK